VRAAALHAGVDPEYVRDITCRLQIKPPVDAPESWPWQFKIITLGRFEILREAERVEFAGRAPRKVLAVLKAIVAGGGDPVPVAQLTDSLWSHEEGDAQFHIA
jgi:hypothetical protein